MCIADLHIYAWPCCTFLYRMVKPCRSSGSCMALTIRQRHFRTEGPCRQVRACAWCKDHEGQDREAMLAAWQLAKENLSVVPLGFAMEYRGTTYYDSLPLAVGQNNAKTPQKRKHKPLPQKPLPQKPLPKKPYAGPLIVHSTPVTRTFGKSNKSNMARSATPCQQNGLVLQCKGEFKHNGSVKEGKLPWHFEWHFYRDIDPQAKFSVVVTHSWVDVDPYMGEELVGWYSRNSFHDANPKIDHLQPTAYAGIPESSPCICNCSMSEAPQHSSPKMVNGELSADCISWTPRRAPSAPV